MAGKRIKKNSAKTAKRNAKNSKKSLTPRKVGRRNIRKIISNADLSEATKAATKIEEQRKIRIIEKEEWVSVYHFFMFLLRYIFQFMQKL